MRLFPAIQEALCKDLPGFSFQTGTKGAGV